MSRSINIVLALIVTAVLAIQACSSGGDSDTPWPNPLPTQSPAGVWIGTLSENETTFTVGIVKKDGTTRWIQERKQYSGTLESAAGVLSGQLNAYTWDTTGTEEYGVTSSPVSVAGFVAEKALLQGAYTEEENTTGVFDFLYTQTTASIDPSVKAIEGQWIIKNAYKKGNTLTLTITTTGTSNITGFDDDGNSLEGTITILYTPPDYNYNVYSLDLDLDNGSGTHELTGLAAYLADVNTSGITIDELLAIGASSPGLSLSGLATRP